MTWGAGKQSYHGLARGVARGHGSHKGYRRIVVSFDEETFDAVRKLAESTGTSFAEQVRLLVEWGLEAEK